MDAEGRPHPYATLDYHGERVEVDVEIVPLVERLWALDFDTLLSCQDQDGRVWVEFPGPSAEQFLDLVARSDSELRANVLGLVPIDTDDFEAHKREHAWQFLTVALRGDDRGVWLSVGVRFPRSDLPAVMAALGAKGAPA